MTNAAQDGIKQLTKKDIYLLSHQKLGTKTTTDNQVAIYVLKKTHVYISRAFIVQMKNNPRGMRKKEALIFADFLDIDINTIQLSKIYQKPPRPKIEPPKINTFSLIQLFFNLLQPVNSELKPC